VKFLESLQGHLPTPANRLLPTELAKFGDLRRCAAVVNNAGVPVLATRPAPAQLGR
jgi:hypothetical protein